MPSPPQNILNFCQYHQFRIKTASSYGQRFYPGHNLLKLLSIRHLAIKLKVYSISCKLQSKHSQLWSTNQGLKLRLITSTQALNNIQHVYVVSVTIRIIVTQLMVKKGVEAVVASASRCLLASSFAVAMSTMHSADPRLYPLHLHITPTPNRNNLSSFPQKNFFW